MDGTVSPDEPVARFINQQAYYRKGNKTVKHNAFMPSRQGEVSIYRTDQLDESEIYEIGDKYVGVPQNKQILGYASIEVSDIEKHELSVESAPSIHPRHANIIVWPDIKSSQKMIAMEIAEEAGLHLR